MKGNNLDRKAVVIGIAVVFIVSAFIPAVGLQVGSTVTSQSSEKSENINSGVEESVYNLDSIDSDFIQYEPLGNPGPLPLDAGAPWWNIGWQYRKNITIDHSKVADDLTNFPVLINITDNDLKDDAQDNGNDIVFTDYSGNQLHHGIEFFNGSSGELVCWVNVSSLSGSEDTILYMYYGNPSCEDQGNSSGVWDSNFVMVQHLNETSGDHIDSTTYSNDGTIHGDVNQDAIGLIDGANDFDGDGDYIDITDNLSLDLTSFTLSFWAKADSDATGNWYIADKREQNENDFYLNYGVIWNYDGGFVAARSGDGIESGVIQARWDSNPTRGEWHHFISMYDGSTLYLYVDGDQKATLSQSFTPYSTSNDIVQIGRCGYATAYRYFDGSVDEVRISSINRSAAWINTEYNSQRNPNTFYGIGSEETSIPPVAPLFDDEYPENGSVEVRVGIVTFSISVNDFQGDDMNVYFRTNASGTWGDIDSNTTVPNGTYSQEYTFNEYEKKYWWSVNASDPGGSGNWTNETYHFTTELTPGAWWDYNWHYRKMIKIDHSKFDSDLYNFPFLINLTDMDIASHTQENGNDIVFSNYSGVKLYHEIEYYNNSTGKLLAWVNITHLSSLEDTIIYLYYGNTFCGSQQCPSGVWDSNYVMVQHLNETSGTHYDSTTFGNGAIAYGGLNQDAVGVIDGADFLDGLDDYIDGDSVVNNLDISEPWTVEIWGNTTTVGVRDKLVEFCSSSNDEYVFIGFHDVPVNAFKIGSNAKTPGQGSSYLSNTSYHVVLVWDGSKFILYLDGMENYNVTPSDSGVFLSGLNRFVVGSHYDYQITGDYMDNHSGFLDELRVSNIERNPEWIKICYNNQINPTSFYNIKYEENVSFYPSEPQIFNPNPPDKSTNIEFNPLLNIDICDYQGDEINISFMTNSTGGWQQIGGTQTGHNGTYYQATTMFNEYHKKYWWSVNVTDSLGSGEWNNKTFSFTTEQMEPIDIYFTLENNPDYYSSFEVHPRDPDGSTTNDIIHVDLLYFPYGWGNVNGSSYKYWLANTPFPGGNDLYEQPCILVSNNLTNDSWVEPADNYWDTNPITKWVWDSVGHYSDCDLVYNDDTDEIYYYFRNSSGSSGGWKRVELMKSSDGVNWTWVSQNVNVSTPPSGVATELSPAVVKQDDVWHMWVVNASPSPNVIEHWISSNGTWFELNCKCSLSFIGDSFQPWHLEVDAYNGEYWGVVNEQPNGNLYLINSSDGYNWIGHGNPILSTNSSGWDSSYLYRSTYIIKDNNFEMIYVGVGGSGHHIAYTHNASVVGSGVSSGVIVGLAPEEPQLSNPNPSQAEINVNFNPLLSIDVIDYQGDEVNITFMTNATGSWGQIGVTQKGYNDTYYQTTTVFNEYNKKYWWSVNATDPDGSGNWTNETYQFTTEYEPTEDLLIISYMDPTPLNGSINSSKFVKINVSISENGSSMKNLTYNWNNDNYSFYDNSLVLMMNFDNKSELGESDTNIVDISNNFNNGTVYNDAHYILNGKYNGAYRFDGSGDYVLVQEDTSLNVEQGEFTFMVWIKPTSIDNYDVILAKDDQPGVSLTSGYRLMFDNSVPQKVRLLVYDGNTEDVLSSTSPTLNTWTHVAGVYNGSYLKLYINGILNDVELIDGSIVSDSADLGICSVNDGASNYFQGSIDDICIFNRSFNDEEIQEFYFMNLEKYNNTQWYLRVNQSKSTSDGLDDGTYTYQIFALNNKNNWNSSEKRYITISSPEDNIPPEISFINPTPENNSNQTETYVLINVSINDSNLANVNFNWNGTNYSIYNEDLVLMMNFDNVSNIGEDNTHIIDQSTYSCDGTAYNDAYPTSSGKYNGAFEFENTNGIVNILDSDTLSFGNGLDDSPFSICIWINMHDATRFRTIGKYTDGYEWAFGTAGTDGLNFWARDDSTLGYIGRNTTPITSYENQWIYTVATYDGSETSSGFKIYINGIQSDTQDYSSGTYTAMENTNSNVTIGSFLSTYSDGKIDELRIYKKCLSILEIQELYKLNLRKYDLNNWNLYVNQSGLSNGNYIYQALASDNSDNWNNTEEREIIINSEEEGTIDILSPVQYQIIQRHNDTNGIMQISGTYTGNPGSIEASFNEGVYYTIDDSPVGGTFNGFLDCNIGQGTLTVRFSNNPSVNDTINYIGIGDVFVIAGQSNAEGYGTNNNILNSSNIYDATVYRQDDSWRIANDPIDSNAAGSPWVKTADYIIQNQNIPVAYISTAVSGVSVTTWQKGQVNYNNMLNQISEATDGSYKVKAMLYYQGERDARTDSGLQGNYAAYKENLSNMVDDFINDVEIADVVIIGQINNQPSSSTRNSIDNIRRAQQELWDEHSNVSAGPITYDINLSDDDLHYRTDKEIGVFADRWWASISEGIYGIGDGRGPILNTVNMYDNDMDSIIVKFDESSTPLKINDWLDAYSTKAQGWRIDDGGMILTDNDIVETTIINDNEILINLSMEISNNANIYIGSYTDGYGKNITRDNSTFKLPVEPFNSSITILSGDTTPPGINYVNALPYRQESGKYVNITANVTDNNAVDEVYLNVTYPDLTYENISITGNISGNNVYYCNQTYPTTGLYLYKIWANDTNGNSNISPICTFSIVRWKAVINVSDTSGKFDTAVFGEMDDASDGKDQLDVPKPISSNNPYVRSWFDAGLSSPYDELWEDYRDYPDDQETWDLYIRSNTTLPAAGDTQISISWESDEINDSEYVYVSLYYCGNDTVVADMKTNNSYTFDSFFDVTYHFQINCSSNQPPFAGFAFEPTIPFIFETVYFNSTSSDPDGSIVNWTWDFGDGNISYGEQVTHIYEDYGIYNVILTVLDNDLASNTTYILITVEKIDIGIIDADIHDGDTRYIGSDTLNVTIKNLGTITTSVMVNLTLEWWNTTASDWEEVDSGSKGPYDLDPDVWVESFFDVYYDLEGEYRATFSLDTPLYSGWNDNDSSNDNYIAEFDVNKKPVLLNDLDHEPDTWNWTVIYSDPIIINIEMVEEDGETLKNQSDQPKIVKLEYYNGTEWILVTTDSLSDPSNDDKNLTLTFEIEEFQPMDECADDWPLRFRFDGDDHYNPVNHSGNLTVLKESPVFQDVDPLSDTNSVFGDWNWTVMYSDSITITINLTDDDGENLSHQKDQPKKVYLEYNNGSDWIHIANDTLSDPSNDDKNLSFSFIMDDSAGLYDIQFRFDGDCRFNTVTHDGTLNVVIPNRITLSNNWNLISLPFNESIDKVDITISYLGSNYTWQQAVTNGYILNFIYGWNRGAENQGYENVDALQPGHGYWVWSYHDDVDLFVSSNETGDGYITLLKQKWNTIGLPYNTSLDKQDLIVNYNGLDYSWYEATSGPDPIILGYIYGWNENIQNYILSDNFDPGRGYWMYAYYNCTLKKEIS